MFLIHNPDEGAQRRNPGWIAPDFVSLHPGYGPYLQ
jgi:hypothetical protein